MNEITSCLHQIHKVAKSFTNWMISSSNSLPMFQGCLNHQTKLNLLQQIFQGCRRTFQGCPQHIPQPPHPPIQLIKQTSSIALAKHPIKMHSTQWPTTAILTMCNTSMPPLVVPLELVSPPQQRIFIMLTPLSLCQWQKKKVIVDQCSHM